MIVNILRRVAINDFLERFSGLAPLVAFTCDRCS